MIYGRDIYSLNLLISKIYAKDFISGILLTIYDLFIFICLIRGTETQQEIDVRLANAEKEIMESQEKGLFDAIIINDNFESASKAFFRLIRDWFVILS